MLALTHNPSAENDNNVNEDRTEVRDIHALTPPPNRRRRGEAWETGSHRSAASSAEAETGENFTTMSREFSALVLAGSNNAAAGAAENGQLTMIGEDGEEGNQLAVVADSNNGVGSPGGGSSRSLVVAGRGGQAVVTAVQRVKKEEVEAKISAWENAEVAKVNNRFKRDDAVINGWENEQVLKSTSWMNKVERKLEEKRARAMEKMHNQVAKAHGKAEERRASAEAKRGTKVAEIMEVANLMRSVGKPPANKRAFI